MIRTASFILPCLSIQDFDRWSILPLFDELCPTLNVWYKTDGGFANTWQCCGFDGSACCVCVTPSRILHRCMINKAFKGQGVIYYGNVCVNICIIFTVELYSFVINIFRRPVRCTFKSNFNEMPMARRGHTLVNIQKGVYGVHRLYEITKLIGICDIDKWLYNTVMCGV